MLFTTAENRIVNHFVTHKNAKLFWDADAHYVENDKHEEDFFSDNIFNNGEMLNLVAFLKTIKL